MKFLKVIKGAVQFVGRLADNIFTGGLIHNTIEETVIKTKSSLVLKTVEKGKTDFPKWFAMLILTLPLWFMIAVKMGWITLEEATFLLDNAPEIK